MKPIRDWLKTDEPNMDELMKQARTELARLGGLASADKMSPLQRRERARKAAHARWHGNTDKEAEPPEVVPVSRLPERFRNREPRRGIGSKDD